MLLQLAMLQSFQTKNMMDMQIFQQQEVLQKLNVKLGLMKEQEKLLRYYLQKKLKFLIIKMISLELEKNILKQKLLAQKNYQ